MLIGTFPNWQHIIFLYQNYSFCQKWTIFCHIVPKNSQWYGHINNLILFFPSYKIMAWRQATSCGIMALGHVIWHHEMTSWCHDVTRRQGVTSQCHLTICARILTRRARRRRAVNSEAFSSLMLSVVACKITLKFCISKPKSPYILVMMTTMSVLSA